MTSGGVNLPWHYFQVELTRNSEEDWDGEEVVIHLIFWALWLFWHSHIQYMYIWQQIYRTLNLQEIDVYPKWPYINMLPYLLQPETAHLPLHNHLRWWLECEFEYNHFSKQKLNKTHHKMVSGGKSPFSHLQMVILLKFLHLKDLP